MVAQPPAIGSPLPDCWVGGDEGRGVLGTGVGFQLYFVIEGEAAARCKFSFGIERSEAPDKAERQRQPRTWHSSESSVELQTPPVGSGPSGSVGELMPSRISGITVASSTQTVMRMV